MHPLARSNVACGAEWLLHGAAVLQRGAAIATRRTTTFHRPRTRAFQQDARRAGFRAVRARRARRA